MSMVLYDAECLTFPLFQKKRGGVGIFPAAGFLSEISQILWGEDSGTNGRYYYMYTIDKCLYDYL